MKTKNNGKLLKKAMLKKGLKKFHVAALLKVTRPTLNTRLIDGEFNDEQIETLKKEGLLV